MKIVVVDDQTIIRKGVISILSSQDTMEVSGEAGNKHEALLLIQREKPDLTIVDFHLGKESGLDLITEARQIGCTCKFAILTYSKDQKSFERAKVMDVDGYISLESHPEEIIYALQMIQRGRKYYDPDIIDLLMQAQKKPRIDNSRIEFLTSKEREVLQKIGVGFSNKQIAENLFITENTVKKHVSQVLSKLNLGDRTQAALYANETGLVQYKYDLLV
ncbi:response regulator transcription factor [Sporosarcina sp. ANT_H38]|uniref:LuxR C-terminal-related transcriptional regulator n=1 Tax=Sporosarcina sp. ANT_H38 TaxID=2597358 RepID=UPI0011F0F1EE|nr:response regulator transcription factor [Sporosarcina sp. ANT_H38]KAA0955966.1 response regulator transcription factor [Sporosarcina sp. ANT_H38]